MTPEVNVMYVAFDFLLNKIVKNDGQKRCI